MFVGMNTLHYINTYVSTLTSSHVIVLGDVNTSHRKIDHCYPAEDMVSPVEASVNVRNNFKLYNVSMCCV